MRKNSSAQFWPRVDRSGDCWLWTGRKDASGYGVFDIGGTYVRAHRFSWTLANGTVPDGLRVLHRCDVPACVRPDHLFVGTQIENIRDMDAKGRRTIRWGDAIRTPNARVSQAKGSRHGMARLTEADVLAIRERIAAGEMQLEIAADYMISRTAISRINKRRNWTHVV